MRTSALQYLYLQKPITMVVLICIISVLPWIGYNNFSTKGEPREASVAISMLESGNYILPRVYADEFAYKPPFVHWLMAAASYPQGYVSEFTSRLPSAVAFVILIGFVLLFFGKRVKFQEAFIATLMLITCVEFHRAAMTTRVDMILTTLIVLALIQLYRWEEKLELKGLPIIIPLLMSGAILTKGPIGVILPLFVFGCYLLILQKYKLTKIIKVLLYAFIASLFLPALWYIAAWKQGGSDFFDVVMAENFGRFFSLATPKINYHLGHENNFLYNFQTLLTGFIPWSLFFIFALFGLKITLPKQSIKTTATNLWNKIQMMSKPHLFSLVVVVCVLFFYSIPSSKRSVYLLPAYPFLALFMAQGAIYITEYRTKVTRVFAAFIAAIATVGAIATTLTVFKAIDLVAIVGNYTSDSGVLMQVDSIQNALTNPSIITILILAFYLIILFTTYYQMSKKINIKILYATIALAFAINLYADGVIVHALRERSSCKEFAKELKDNFPLTDKNTYVLNDLMSYRNMYGLNFYMGNNFNNFEENAPLSGYLFITENDFPKLQSDYSDYVFDIVSTSKHEISEVHCKILLTYFKMR